MKNFISVTYRGHGRVSRGMWFSQQLRGNLTEVLDLLLDRCSICQISQRVQIDHTFIGQIVEDIGRSDRFWA